MKIYIIIFLSIFSLTCKAQNETEYLTKSEIENDLKFLDDFIQNQSSYQGLNGFDYREDFHKYLEQIDGNKISKSDFGIFLTKTIGKIGDRHSYIRGYDLPNNLFLPFVVAPLNDKVVALNYNKSQKEYHLLYQKFPFLKAINTIQIDDFLKKVVPKDIKAPEIALRTRSVKQLKYMADNYAIMRKTIPENFEFTFTNGKTDTIVKIPLENKRSTYITWDEKFKRVNNPKRKDLNKPELIKNLFHIDEDNIAYLRIPNMVDQEEASVFFQTINEFMVKAKSSVSLIIDVRGNGGGTRHLINEFAGYFINPNTSYIVNATRQRGKLPLNEDLKDDLHNRFLFSRNELDAQEQDLVDKFMSTFVPMYNLDDNKYSEFHYFVLNGKKLTKDKYHYDKSIYIMTNEKSFSAASVFASVFKEIPNIKLVGVNTDGSSGNSERFELPNSELRGKISTMVSFQKNGQILDGIGTKPDITIERNLDQILWKEDYQLNKLKELIKKE
ncbi:S41 family peptidase [Winogradskyella immobilis]|uniref:Peptidase S41 n=1 Tax=Winogradskyella immobilis TaxID=2816852 RepID=A0ABS8EQU2_9FLAO|nr:S41 family peptidase [Winogradskyella immobilis]MCC1485548.1 peptidase S41 [Winogradskyella immobilis]MCG0017640.1 peptidase S41 [Winogradskyella immobilis]